MSIRSCFVVSCLLLFVGLAAPTADAAPTARFLATRIQGASCVAPCAVHFDAIGNGADQSADPDFGREFHTMLFEWDFGDPSAGTWATTGASKNRAVGAIAGHLFETPGTYTVRLAVTNPSGQTGYASRSVVVGDPAATFSTANTWCFANAGTPGGAGFEACPVRATAQHRVISANTSGGFNSALATCGASSRKSRCLFRAGDSFRASSMASLGNQAGPGLVASFGSGARPRVTGGSGFVSLGDGWTVAHFDVNLAGGDPLFRLSPERSGATVVDVRGRNVRGPCFESATGGGRYQSDRVGIFTMDCLNHPNATNAALYLRADRVLAYGNRIDNGYGGQFVFRSVHLARSVIAHNSLLRPKAAANDRRNVMQIRAWSGTTNGAAISNVPPPAKSEWVIIADNVLGQDNADTFFRTCQTNDCTDASRAQDVQNLLIERNFLLLTSGGGNKGRVPRAFQVQGGDVTIRNNVLDLQGLDTAAVYGTDGLFDHQANMARVPGLNDDRIHVLNNTVYYDDASRNGFTFCRGGSVGAAHLCRGNLAWLPNQTGSRQITDGGSWTSSHNLYAGTNPFAAAIPQQGSTVLTSFRARPSGPAADASYDYRDEPMLRLDAANRCRPADGADADAIAHWDNGAFEANATNVCRRLP